MRIMFLDDCPERTRTFLAHASAHEVDVVSTADAAISTLGEGRYDLIFLDYDLSNTKARGQVARNGIDVARALQGMTHLAGARVFVHSMCDEARAAMKDILRLQYQVHLPEELGRECLWEVPIDSLLRATAAGGPPAAGPG
jgi:hypothetical protein